MNWDAIGAVGEVVGAAAVVVSIVYLAVQIRQNTSSTRSAVESEIALALANAAFEGADGPIPEIMFRGLGDFDKLNDEEKARFVFYVLGWFRVWQLAYDQRNAGNLSDDSWESLTHFIASAYASPGVPAFHLDHAIGLWRAGDVGAATGPLLVTQALMSAARRAAPGRFALAWAGSVDGTRAATAVELPSN